MPRFFPEKGPAGCTLEHTHVPLEPNISMDLDTKSSGVVVLPSSYFICSVLRVALLLMVPYWSFLFSVPFPHVASPPLFFSFFCGCTLEHTHVPLEPKISMDLDVKMHIWASFV
ncbi:uncharacterized protein LOC144799839 isoform X2 [Lissotriton helveticus]